MHEVRTHAANKAREILETAIANGNAFVVLEIKPESCATNLDGYASVCGFAAPVKDAKLKVASAVLELSRMLARVL